MSDEVLEGLLKDALEEIDRLRVDNARLAKYVVGMWDRRIWEASDDLQELGEELGLAELRSVTPGSVDAEEWGEDAKLYYLLEWVREAARGLEEKP